MRFVSHIKLMKEYPESNWAKNKESEYKELKEKFGEKEYEYPEFTPERGKKEDISKIKIEEPVIVGNTPITPVKDNIRTILMVIISVLILVGLFFIKAMIKRGRRH